MYRPCDPAQAVHTIHAPGAVHVPVGSRLIATTVQARNLTNTTSYIYIYDISTDNSTNPLPSRRRRSRTDSRYSVWYYTSRILGCVFPLHLGIITTCVKKDYIYIHIAAKKGTLTTDGAKRIYSSI